MSSEPKKIEHPALLKPEINYAKVAKANQERIDQLNVQNEDLTIELMWRRDQLCFLQAAIKRIEKIATSWRGIGVQRACNHICEISAAAFDLVDVVADSEGKETPELTLEREWFLMLIEGVLDTVDPVDDISRN